MDTTFVHTVIDDYSRVAYAKIHDDKTAATAVTATYLPPASLYQDLGADYHTRLRPDRAKTRAVALLEALGFTFALTSTS